MFTFSKKIPTALVMLFCVLFSLVGFSERAPEQAGKVEKQAERQPAGVTSSEMEHMMKLIKQSKQAEQAKQQQEDKVLINVDADVIEVEVAELYKMGVSPIGQGKDSVLLRRRISQCLKEGKAKVICGVTLSVVDGEQASAKQECQKRIRIKEDPRKDIYINLEESLSFGVLAKGITEDKIFLQFSFNQTYYETPEEPNEATRPPMIKRDWNSYLTLKPGTPKITGRIQEGKKSYFLIMSADVED